MLLRTALVLGATASVSAFSPTLVPQRSRACGGMSMQQEKTSISSRVLRVSDIATSLPSPSTIEKMVSLNPTLFRQLDVDNSGSVDAEELKALFKKEMAHKWKSKTSDMDEAKEIDLMFTRADLNGNGSLDIGEFERLLNMQQNGDQAGGNAWTQAAIKFRLLNPNSPLADGVASTLVGNKGFDPLGFATSLKTLKAYREAEAKHGRLAMLAALGWPISELFQPFLARSFGAPDLLSISANGLAKAPSVLNGGLDKISPFFFMAIIIFTSTVESVALNKIRSDDYIPGDLGFDPLDFYTSASSDTKREFELKEINNGRLAMLAITGYVAQEFYANAPVFFVGSLVEK